MTALGIFHTPMGDYLVFPCGCENPDPKRYKASLYRNMAGITLTSISQPSWHTFETDYIFEDRAREVEVED